MLCEGTIRGLFSVLRRMKWGLNCFLLSFDLTKLFGKCERAYLCARNRTVLILFDYSDRISLFSFHYFTLCVCVCT